MKWETRQLLGMRRQRWWQRWQDAASVATTAGRRVER